MTPVDRAAAALAADLEVDEAATVTWTAPDGARFRRTWRRTCPGRRSSTSAAGQGVGSELRARGARRVVGVDLEPAVEVAVPRDRPGVDEQVRALDLTAPGEHAGWLRALRPDVVTVVAAVGFGHLPLAALEVLTDLLPEGGLLALTVAPELREEPSLAGCAALLDGPAYRPVATRDGVHRRTASGEELPVTALVLRRAGR